MLHNFIQMPFFNTQHYSAYEKGCFELLNFMNCINKINILKYPDIQMDEELAGKDQEDTLHHRFDDHTSAR